MTHFEILEAAVTRLVKRYGTQRAAANALGIDESYITHIKQGRRMPSIPMLNALGIDLVLREPPQGKKG